MAFEPEAKPEPEPTKELSDSSVSEAKGGSLFVDEDGNLFMKTAEGKMEPVKEKVAV